MHSPIYTEITECTDCSKCIRECPVKGIKVESGHAIIDSDLCILCGHCTRVCPRGAKKVRNDLSRAKDIIRTKRRVIASIAPSYISEFPEYTLEQLNGALLKIGFYKVEETAIGAQMVSNSLEINHKDSDILKISSACPVIVNYIKKYRPELNPSVLDMFSPLLAHCSKIKNEVKDCHIIFFGPCIAKKVEADLNPDLLTLALTFKDLRTWLMDESISLNLIEPVEVKTKAGNSAIYPIDGGMIKTFGRGVFDSSKTFNYSGISTILNALKGLEKDSLPGAFFELLACDGGCINGPGTTCKSGTAIKELSVINSISNKNIDIKGDINISKRWDIEPIKVKTILEREIIAVLRSIGKVKPEDEINCGACGYSTCREFGSAIIIGKAETNMCLNYLRKLSEQKVNTLIHTMPSGIIMVDSSMNIIESNISFAKMMGKDFETIYEVNSGLNGMQLERVIYQTEPFIECLKTGVSSERVIKINDKIIQCIVYPVVKFFVVGGIFRDITEPRIQREKIISKAQEVLTKNVRTVQQIAYLLGESAAESEVMLNSIIESFGEVADVVTEK